MKVFCRSSSASVHINIPHLKTFTLTWVLAVAALIDGNVVDRSMSDDYWSTVTKKEYSENIDAFVRPYEPSTSVCSSATPLPIRSEIKEAKPPTENPGSGSGGHTNSFPDSVGDIDHPMFDKLEDIFFPSASSTPSIIPTASASDTPSNQPVYDICAQKNASICYAIDESRSITAEDFKKLKDFVLRSSNEFSLTFRVSNPQRSLSMIKAESFIL